MAAISKKDKLIEEAQKFIQRGQLDKAIKVYEQILALEPAAVNLRQKLAEILIKYGNLDAARKEFETVGKHFSKNGFFLKAVAVYKQLQKLFPSDISFALTLAELNEKLGLVANSLAEYKLVYEYHEKAGNTAESLVILDKMQNVDTQNIPIKIKLAEAYFQHKKINESYLTFKKIAMLLLERLDNGTLTKINARVQQIFPDKPNFMLEVLTEQVELGNAAAVITNIQNLLRSNPNNELIWKLTVRAYQQLNQPQRVKIAYQHYLKYFPTEPTAMLGLISAVTIEQNFNEAIKLLDQYEDSILSAGLLEELRQIYHSLEKLKPINSRIMKGLIKVETNSGDISLVDTLKSKLESIELVDNVSGNKIVDIKSQPKDLEPLSALSDSLPISNLTAFKDTPFELSEVKAFDDRSSETVLESTPTSCLPEVAGVFQPLDEEIEIDIDIDSPFDSLDDVNDDVSTENNWLDSVSDLFETISTAPGSVKFSSDMDSSDAQSHFDLGQAFKEMGLFDEAINEFRKASQDSDKRVKCLIMQCVCLRDRGEVEKAISMLQALLKPGLSIEESCAVKYELATALELIGKGDEAHLLLSEINSANPHFRDISSRIDAANVSETLCFSDDDLKDF